MKIRNGFVSNSSSSSFLLVGYQAKPKATKPEDYRVLVEKKYSAKTIKKYALDYFMDEDDINVDDFNKFPPLFWKEMWKEKKNGTNRNELSSDGMDLSTLEYDVPNGLKLLSDPENGDLYEVVEDGFVGLSIGSAYESNIELSAEKMIQNIEKVKSLAPKDAKVIVIAGEVSN
jgi:hypothetical protein